MHPLSWIDVINSMLIRSYLKKVFWPKLFVGALFQILEIQEYSSGLRRTFKYKNRSVIRLCVKTRPCRDFEPKSFF